MTHRQLRIIVEADSVDEAVAEADEFVDELPPYDWHKAMSEGGKTAGSNRWTKYEGWPDAIPADKPLAMTDIEEAMDRTKRAYAKNFTEALNFVANETPGLLTGIDQSNASKEYEDWMGLIEPWAYEDVTNPSRITNYDAVVTEHQVEALMQNRISMLRRYFERLGRKQYEWCYLYDLTYSSDPIVDSMEAFKRVYDMDYLEGSYLVPIDAHF